MLEAMLEPDRLIWSLAVSVCPLDPADAAFEDRPEEERPKLLATLKEAQEGGKVWPWCDVELACSLPGAAFLQGVAVKVGGHYADAAAFDASEEYAELRREAVEDLERKIDAVGRAYEEARRGRPPDVAWMPQPGTEVFSILDAEPIRGVVQDGVVKIEGCARVVYDGNDGAVIENTADLRPWSPGVKGDGSGG